MSRGPPKRVYTNSKLKKKEESSENPYNIPTKCDDVVNGNLSKVSRNQKSKIHNSWSANQNQPFSQCSAAVKIWDQNHNTSTSVVVSTKDAGEQRILGIPSKHNFVTRKSLALTERAEQDRYQDEENNNDEESNKETFKIPKEDLVKFLNCVWYPDRIPPELEEEELVNPAEETSAFYAVAGALINETYEECVADRPDIKLIVPREMDLVKKEMQILIQKSRVIVFSDPEVELVTMDMKTDHSSSSTKTLTFDSDSRSCKQHHTHTPHLMSIPAPCAHPSASNTQSGSSNNTASRFRSSSSTTGDFLPRPYPSAPNPSFSQMSASQMLRNQPSQTNPSGSRQSWRN